MSGGAVGGGCGPILIGLFFAGAGAAMMIGERKVEERYAPFVDGPTVEARVLGRGTADNLVRVSYTDPSGTRNVAEVEASTRASERPGRGESVEVVLSRTDPSRAVARRRLEDAALVVVGPVQTTGMTAMGLGVVLMGVGLVGAGFLTPGPIGDGGRYRIPGALRWLWFCGGLSALSIAVAFGAPVVGADADTDAFEAGMAVFGVLLLAAGVWCVVISFRMGRYTVFLSRDGIRMGGSSRRVPWSEIARFRERPFLQRMDLLDRDGRRVGMIDYHLAGSEALLDAVRARVRAAPAERRAGADDYPRRFGNRSLQIALTLGGGLVTMALFVAVGNTPVMGVLMGLGVMAAGLIRWGDRDVLRLDLADDALLVSTMVRTRRIPREDVLDVESDLEGDWQGMAASTVVVLRDDRLAVTPAGCDAMEVYEALSRWKEGSGSERPATAAESTSPPKARMVRRHEPRTARRHRVVSRDTTGGSRRSTREVCRLFLDTLVDAMRCMDAECFRVTAAAHERPPIREHLYRYELYHLLRALTVERDVLRHFFFHGDTALGSAGVRGSLTRLRVPDLLLHQPGTDVVSGRMTACEVELAPVSKPDLRAAIGALHQCLAQGYYRAVLVVVGEDRDHARAVAAAAYGLLQVPPRTLTVLWHDEPGSVRTLPFPEEPGRDARPASPRVPPTSRREGGDPPTRPARSAPFPGPGTPATELPDLPPGSLLRDQEQEQPEFLDVLLHGTAGMDATCFERSLTPAAYPELGERLYCYELYHLLRLLMPRRPLLRRFALHGEVHPVPDEFIRRKVGSRNPRFVVHQPGNVWKAGGSLAVVEVELSPLSVERVKAGVEALHAFRDAGYFMSVLIVVGGEEEHVRDAVRPLYEDTKRLGWPHGRHVVWHRRPGEALVLPPPEEYQEKIRRARALRRSKR